MLYTIEYTYKKHDKIFRHQMETLFEEKPTEEEALEYWNNHLKDNNEEIQEINIIVKSTINTIKSLL